MPLEPMVLMALMVSTGSSVPQDQEARKAFKARQVRTEHKVRKAMLVRLVPQVLKALHQPCLALLARLVLKALQVLLALHRQCLALSVQLVRKVRKDLRAIKANKVKMVLSVRLVRKAKRVIQVRKVLKVRKVRKASKARQVQVAVVKVVRMSFGRMMLRRLIRWTAGCGGTLRKVFSMSTTMTALQASGLFRSRGRSPVESRRRRAF